MLVDALLVGISPLLMNRMTEEQLLSLRKTGVKKGKSAGRPERTRDEAEPKLYVTKDGEPYLPTENVFSCLVSAGQMVRLDGKRQVSTAKGTILPSFLDLLDPYILLLHPEGKPVEWEVDMRQGRNPNGGEAVCIIRPRFDQWSFRLAMELDENESTEAILRDLVEKAGKRIGLGDFRPARRGPFGRFRIDEWKTSKTKREDAAAE
jgi:hypothetical protein